MDTSDFSENDLRVTSEGACKDNENKTTDVCEPVCSVTKSYPTDFETSKNSISPSASKEFPKIQDISTKESVCKDVCILENETTTSELSLKSHKSQNELSVALDSIPSSDSFLENKITVISQSEEKLNALTVSGLIENVIPSERTPEILKNKTYLNSAEISKLSHNKEFIHETSVQSDCDMPSTKCNNSSTFYNCDAPKDDCNSKDLTYENNNQPDDFFLERLKFQDTIRQLKLELDTLKSENFGLMTEISNLNKKCDSQEAIFKHQEAKLKSELLSKTEKFSRANNMLLKEKEATVILYANSEKEVIMHKRIQQDLDRKLKDSCRERDTLVGKLKQLSSSVENKTIEVAKLQKENEKLISDANSREVKIKWLQNKLKSEINAHQETQEKLDHTTQRLNDMREEAEQIRKDCQEMIKVYQEAEEIKSFKLDNQLKQKLSELEIQNHEKCDQEQVYMLLRQELEALKRKQRMTMEDNNSLTLKIHNLEKERLEYDQTLCKLKDSQNLLNEEVADLTTRLAEMESLKLQLKQEMEKSVTNVREIERLRAINSDLQSDIDACHVKEGELLKFTEKLTDKTVHLQSEHCLLEIKAQALEDELKEIRKKFADLQKKYLMLEAELEDLKKEYENETQILAQKHAEKTKIVERLNTKLDEAENENRVLKRRHIASIKELSRELSQYKRCLEMYESKNDIKTESLSLGSRASSTASLDMLNSNENRMHQRSSPPSVTFKKGQKGMLTNQEGYSNSQVDVDKERLIEKIIVLQQKLAKKNNKIDFLTEHIHHLVKEMNKKSKMVDFKNV